MGDLIFSDDFFKSATGGLLFLAGLGGPVVLYLLIKDTILNFVAGILIKLNTNFQYINSFEYDSRKNCRVFNIHFTTIEIQDLDADQILTVFNKDFKKAKIWRNLENGKKKINK